MQNDSNNSSAWLNHRSRELDRQFRQPRRPLTAANWLIGCLWGLFSVSTADGYLGPQAIVAAPTGSTLYVACSDSREILWVDVPSQQVSRRLAVAAEPTGLAVSADGSRLYIVCAAPDSWVFIVAVESGEIIGSIPVGHTAMSPVLAPDGQRLYVCNRFDNDISVIDLASAQELSRIPVLREPVAAAITPDGHRLLVANHLLHTRADLQAPSPISAAVSVIDTRTSESVNICLPHGASSLRGICVTPDGHYAFVTHLLSNFENIPFRVDTGWINVNVVSVLDLHAMKRVSTIGTDAMMKGSANPWGITCTADGSHVCVAAAGTHELCVIPTLDLAGDLAKRTMSPLPGAWPIYPSLGESLWRNAELPGKGARMVATIGDYAYVTQYYSDSIAIVELTRPKEGPVRQIQLGPLCEPTRERLGQQLFEDATICYQQWQSCASCHPDGRADGLNWDLMNDGIGNPKNSKSMLHSHVTPPSMVTGVRATAEIAVRSGLAHILFAHRSEEQAAAMDAYLKTLQPVPSPRLVNGQLSEAALRGHSLFQSERVGCSRCHPAPLFTDLKSHRTRSSGSKQGEDLFDTPTLIEVWRTAPYLHAGQSLTLTDVFLEARHGLGSIDGPELTQQELDDLIEYVLSL